ncbi:related to alpha-1,2-mannosidase subfamily [Rhynchosporium agropyri]|uniref:Related to alpha-1,2-mannosidase subfamily n=1 Tax=Rhynchosporium agropyri TaxID=914238 RepID=A0A1E1L737_9HELO|nr:related to alpha-1,2-mannosidase subfamily [Rhynchosporium agropyri]
MPRIRTSHIARAAGAVAVTCLYFLFENPGSPSLRSAVIWRGAGDKDKDVLNLVNMFIGTVNGGHAFPGASLPYGMAKAVADCLGESHGGFSSDSSPISGFSHMHDSGTGGTVSLGNFPIFPQYCEDDDVSTCKFTRNQRVVARGAHSASPGYFDITLADGIRGEATVKAHTALYRFSFPKNISSTGAPLHPVITLDLTDLADTRNGDAKASIHPQTGQIQGSGIFAPSFGTGQYELFFCADFSGAGQPESSIWEGSGVLSNETSKDFVGLAPGGTLTIFSPPKTNDKILVRIGLSFIDSRQACRNAESEIPSFDFQKVRRAAENEWRNKFDVIKIVPGGIEKDLEVIFWSGFYRTMISPQDYTGENPLWNSTEPYFDSFYCIWDSFRSQYPFLTLVDPNENSRMVKALIDIWKFEGKLPDCRMSLCQGFTQGGSNADVVIADAFVKELGGGIDWDLAYRAVISDAEDELEQWDHAGRGSLHSWKTLGFVPIHDKSDDGWGLPTRSVSRTVEFAYNDFCIAAMAEGLNHREDNGKYTSRAENWRNLFNAEQKSSIGGIDTGFTGFFQPRNANLTWEVQDPARCSPLLEPNSCYLDGSGGETYEGASWLYTFFVPQDMAALILLLDGPEKFTKRLDYLHESGLLYMGDEQAFLTVFLYHYAGRPGLSARRAHGYIPKEFNNTINGIPGNDDSGAMGSFVTLTMMGIFPNAGQNVYLITPPFFKEISIFNSQTGKTATIRNINFDPEYKNIYIQNATRDGKTWSRNWIDHSFFAEGGLLELTLGDVESKWGTRREDLPPSMSTKPKDSMQQ